MANVQVQVSSDKLNAFVILKDDGRPLEKGLILSAVKSHGIKFGIKEERIQELEAHPVYNQAILIASGIPPEHGEDARIRILIDEYARRDAQQRVRKGGTPLPIVKAGEIVAIRVPPTEGKEGTDVYGNPIPPRPGKDQSLRCGKNVRVSEDGTKAIAECDGILKVEDEKIIVDELLMIDGDVDYSTGDIDFPGAVLIKGMVKPGFTVKAKKDIEIGSVVEAATVMSYKGEVRIGGVKGRGKGLITGKTIRARFVENANLEADEDVIVEASIINSNVKAGRDVLCVGKECAIVGGNIVAGRRVSCCELGSEVAVHTRVDVGVDPKISEKIRLLKAQLKLDQENLQKLVKVVSLFKSRIERDEDLPQDKKEAYQKALESIVNLRASIEATNQQLKELQEDIEKAAKEAEIIVRNRVFPGVEVTMFSERYVFNQVASKIVLQYRDGQIVFRGYQEEEV
ncbi:MAG: uncharacterized protein PWP37_1008 [Thermotogota bacterium]|nr:uncharacterized protein [Thermotogota bacterium]HCZ06456.1 hypothetical protein [Thermotogota bacterium]